MKFKEEVEQRNIEDLKPHPLNSKIYLEQFENIEKLQKSIEKHGQLEPIVINAKNVIISGHRRFKVLQTLGIPLVDVRVREFENEVEALINFNIQREKRGEDIQKELQYLEKEVYSKTQKGRKSIGHSSENLDKYLDLSKRYEISRTNSVILFRIMRDCPKLIPKIKLKGNSDGTMSINKALQICTEKTSASKHDYRTKDLSKLKTLLKRVDKHELLDLMRSTYPYSIMGTYSKVSKTTSFDFDEDKFKRLDEKRTELIKNLDYLKSLDAREILLYQKVDEVKSLQVPKKTKDEVFANLWKPKDIYDVEGTIKEIENLEPILTRSTSTDEFNTLRVLTHQMTWKQNVGRLLRYVVTNKSDGKYLGLLTIASDVVVIQSRDDKIGWNSQNKFKQKKINNIAIGSTICPTQPLGFNFLGTKLMASLCTLQQVQDDWKREYGDILVGMTTTSLYGSKSSYNGIKWWKKYGTSSGKMILSPSESHYKFWSNWLKENYEGYDSLTRRDDGSLISGPKQKILNKIFQILGISSSNYYHENNRGVYFCPFYENTNEFLRGEISESELKPKTDGLGDLESIMTWWLIKSRKRYKKLIDENRIDDDPVWYDDIQENDVKYWLEIRGKNPILDDE